MKAVLCTLNAKYIHSSLALRYLKRYSENPAWQIETIEFTINQPFEDIRTRLYLCQPDVLSFSCYIWNIESVLDLCRDLRSLLPDCVFILGGPEVSFDASDLLECCENITIVIRGEGEESLKQVLESITQGSSLSTVKGISYREGSVVINNPDRELLKDLDSIPTVFDSDMSEYQNRLLYYESSRGCPFNCTYCLSSTFIGVRTFSMDRVKQDLILIMNRRFRTVKFIDRTFNCNEKRAREIMEFILEHNIESRFHFEVCADLISDDFLNFLLQVPAGVFSFEIGIQSTYLPALEAVNRSCDMAKFMSNVQRLAAQGNIHLHLDLIAGLPEEGYKEFQRSFNMVYSLYPDVIQLGFLKMLKGSKLRSEASKYGYKYQEGPPYQVLFSDYMSHAELIRLSNIEKLLERYYNSGEFAKSLEFIIDSVYKRDAFTFFEGFASFCEEQDWFGQGHSRLDEYNMLITFIEGIWPDLKTMLCDYLKYDFVYNNRHSPLPERLRNTAGATHDQLYRLLKDRDFIAQNIPECSNLSKYDLSKRVQLEIFEMDPTVTDIPKMLDTKLLFVYPINQRKAERVIFISKELID